MRDWGRRLGSIVPSVSWFFFSLVCNTGHNIFMPLHEIVRGKSTNESAIGTEHNLTPGSLHMKHQWLATQQRQRNRRPTTWNPALEGISSRASRELYLVDNQALGRIP
jgi:hypothetical protein